MDDFNKKTAKKHWAEYLEIGDKVLANVRHETDGSKNKMKQEAIVIMNFPFDWKVKLFVNGFEKEIDYNELTAKP